MRTSRLAPAAISALTLSTARLTPLTMWSLDLASMSGPTPNCTTNDSAVTPALRSRRLKLKSGNRAFHFVIMSHLSLKYAFHITASYLSRLVGDGWTKRNARYERMCVRGDTRHVRRTNRWVFVVHEYIKAAGMRVNTYLGHKPMRRSYLPYDGRGVWVIARLQQRSDGGPGCERRGEVERCGSLLSEGKELSTVNQ